MHKEYNNIVCTALNGNTTTKLNTMLFSLRANRIYAQKINSYFLIIQIQLLKREKNKKEFELTCSVILLERLALTIKGLHFEFFS